MKKNGTETISSPEKKICEKDNKINEYERIIGTASEAIAKEAILYNQALKRLNEYKKIVDESRTLRIVKKTKTFFGLPKRAIKRVKRKFEGVKRHRNKSEGETFGVSVVIATYREIPGIYRAVQSALDQTFPAERMEILIVVNGSDKAYFEKLSAQYAGIPEIKIFYTSRRGLGAARNIGIEKASKEFITFLGDDDYFTDGYIQDMAGRVHRDVNIVFGKLADKEIDGTYNHDTRINTGIKKIGHQAIMKYLDTRSLFENMPCKLYRAKMLQNDFGKIPEDMQHTEDIMYWAQNVGSIRGKVAAVDPDSEEGYIRVLTEDDMPQVDGTKMEKFLLDKVDIIGDLTRLFFDPKTAVPHKKFIKNLMIAQGREIEKECDHDLGGVLREKVDASIRKHRTILFPEYLLATKKGVAFCQMFPPELDPSANVAAKRLKQINGIEGERIAWHVIKQDLQAKRKVDRLFDQLFASFVYQYKSEAGHGEMSHVKWAESAFNRAVLMQSHYLYSRSMHPGSHVAAYKYKKLYPKVKWYAEFSDPLSRDIYGKKRREKDDLFENIERMVYEDADVIIFTNSNQMAYMLDYNPNKELEERIRTRSMVLRHPEIDDRYVRFIEAGYALQPEKINIAYFGSFYKNRSYHHMIDLLFDERIVLHIFTPDYFKSDYHEINKDMRKKGIDAARLKTHDAVPYFGMLNIASKMDYVFLEDADFAGAVNPFLPSKLTDYLVSGSRIIALIRQGSPISAIDDGQIIKIEKITREFLSTLHVKGRIFAPNREEGSKEPEEQSGAVGGTYGR
jgi:glycosyltransferase involved in cell wall biosynthesis